MGRDLAARFPLARETFEEADDCLGFRLSALCYDGPPADLGRTEHAQPAILTTSVATFRVLVETASLEPHVLAGHSLGEWSALVAAGAMRFADAVRGVRERGRLMQDAVPRGVGAMAAVMGLGADEVAALCRDAAEGEVVTPANLNGAGQVVVAGHAGAVERLMEMGRARGARVTRLDVSAPFHCPLMAPAAEGVGRFLRTVPVQAPAAPVVTSVEARPLASPAEITSLLVAQVTAPVRWEETMHVVQGFAPAVALEVGPGRVLSGIAKRMWPDIPCHPVAGPEEVATVGEVLG